MSNRLHKLSTTGFIILAIGFLRVAADPNDWVNVDYVLQQPQSDITADAQNSIIDSASYSAKSGPWTVTNAKGYLPPSGDTHDYLSWAPYHWPNCDWCGQSSANSEALAQGQNSTDGSSAQDGGGSPGASDNSTSYDPNDPYAEEFVFPATVAGSANLQHARIRDVLGVCPHCRMRRTRRAFIGVDENALHPNAASIDGSPRNPSFAASPTTGINQPSLGPLPIDILPVPQDPIGGLPPMPTLPPTVGAPLPIDPSASGTPTTQKQFGSTAPPVEEDPSRTKQGKQKCTTSSTSVAPTATWTTCPYIPEDGKVNPDVRHLNGPDAITDASQSALYNAIAFALNQQSEHSSNVASFINTFFLDSSTKMNPNMNYGQVVRGPGVAGQEGTFTGVLDLRGTVKIVNSILLMRAIKSPDWTSALDAGMVDWMTTYVDWLKTSDIGKQTASRPNNHATFYVSQLTAAQMLINDISGAQATLQNYFSNQFLDQIAKAGEQPFEAVRTRPYHYRCFNLEAMITNAKLGDQLGLNFWTAKSKYGSTIQNALDYTMALDPKNENVEDIFPHVAAVAAAYGDPDGKYAAFLQKEVSNYKTLSFWYYDQSAALPNSPAGGKSTKRSGSPYAVAARDVSGVGNVTTGTTDTPFSCPSIFNIEPEAQIADGIYVTCDELEPFYEIIAIGTP